MSACVCWCSVWVPACVGVACGLRVVLCVGVGVCVWVGVVGDARNKDPTLR